MLRVGLLFREVLRAHHMILTGEGDVLQSSVRLGGIATKNMILCEVGMPRPSLLCADQPRRSGRNIVPRAGRPLFGVVTFLAHALVRREACNGASRRLLDVTSTPKPGLELSHAPNHRHQALFGFKGSVPSLPPTPAGSSERTTSCSEPTEEVSRMASTRTSLKQRKKHRRNVALLGMRSEVRMDARILETKRV